MRRELSPRASASGPTRHAAARLPQRFEAGPARRNEAKRLIAAVAAGAALAVLLFAGCSGWDPARPFERNAPAVDEAIGELDAGRAEPAEKLLEEYLGTGPCSADAGIALPDAVRQKHAGSFDLGLTLFYLSEKYGRRFGDEEGDGGVEDEARAARRSADIECALAIARAIANDPKVATELRARAYFLAGNLELLRRRYEQAVKEYDQALALVPGIAPDANGDGIGRDVAWNRAIALRRIQDREDAGTDAPDANDANDGSDGSDAADASDGSDGSDAADASDGSDGGDAGPDGGDGGQDGGGDGGKGDGGQDGGGGDAGAEPKEAPPQQASPSQDERLLEQLEQRRSYQEQEAKKRAAQRRMRPTMEDK